MLNILLININLPKIQRMKIKTGRSISPTRHITYDIARLVTFSILLKIPFDFVRSF